MAYRSPPTSPRSPKDADAHRRLSMKLEKERRSGRITDLLRAYREDRLDEHLNQVAVETKNQKAKNTADSRMKGKQRFKSLPGPNSKLAPDPKKYTAGHSGSFKPRLSGVSENAAKFEKKASANRSQSPSGAAKSPRTVRQASMGANSPASPRGMRGVPANSPRANVGGSDRKRAATSSGRFYAVQKRGSKRGSQIGAQTTPQFEKMRIEVEGKEHELLRKAEELRRRESNIRRKSQEVRNREAEISKRAEEMNEELKQYAIKTGQPFLEKFCNKCGKRREMNDGKPAKFCVACGYTFLESVGEDEVLGYDESKSLQKKHREEEEARVKAEEEKRQQTLKLLQSDLVKREEKMKKWEEQLQERQEKIKKEQEQMAEETARKLKEEEEKRKIKQKEEAMRIMEEELQKREEALAQWENAVKAAQDQEVQKANENQRQKFQELAKLEQEAERKLREAKEREEKLKKAEQDLKKLMDAADAAKRLESQFNDEPPDWDNLPARRSRTIQSITEEERDYQNKETALEKAKAKLKEKQLKLKEAEMKQSEIVLKKKIKDVEKMQKTLSLKGGLNMSEMRSHMGDIIECHNCAGKVSKEQKFCDNCGAKVLDHIDIRRATAKQLVQDLSCPRCDEKILSTSKFCKHCGCKISTQSASSERGRKAHRRQRSRHSRASSLEREPGFNELVETAQGLNDKDSSDKPSKRSSSVERTTPIRKKEEKPAPKAQQKGKQLKCAKCATTLPNYFKFCDICGTRL